jgi:hypothetical protein
LAPKNEKFFIMKGTVLRAKLIKIVHIGNVSEVEKLLNTLGVFVKRKEITYWPCYDKSFRFFFLFLYIFQVCFRLFKNV